jgi:AcrR family transcriptional regulator
MSPGQRTVLEAATQALLADPTASMAQIARAAGVSRTTLHARFPSRHALVEAMAVEALDLVEAALAGARLDEGDVRAALHRAVEALVPLGPRSLFLLRERSLDAVPELVERYERLADPLLRLVERGQRAGALRPDLPAWWVVDTLDAVTHAAWEAVADGRLAPRDAPRTVLAAVLDGAAPR